MMKKIYAPLYATLLGMLCLLNFSDTANAQITDADVGDAASFGKEVRFFGTASLVGTVYLHKTCLPADITLEPNDKCLIINSTTNSVVFDLRDLGRITFPENTFQNVIYPQSKNFLNYELINTGTINKTGFYNYRPYITFESAVLNDLSLINPNTGQPFAGKIDINLSGYRTFRSTLVPGGNFSNLDSYSIHSSFTKKSFVDSYGLSSATVDKIFQNKIVIRLNIKGSATLINTGYVFYNVRFLGN
jgi:hypothetical protein